MRAARTGARGANRTATPERATKLFRRVVRAHPRLDGPELVFDGRERVDGRRIELRARTFEDAAPRFLDRERGTIRARRRHRVVAVGDGHEARMEGDALPGQAVWIP